MIRQSENQVLTEAKSSGEKAAPGSHPHKDNELWAPTGWVHVQKDIDFSDPKVIQLTTFINHSTILPFDFISYYYSMVYLQLSFT